MFSAGPAALSQPSGGRRVERGPGHARSMPSLSAPGSSTSSSTRCGRPRRVTSAGTTGWTIPGRGRRPPRDGGGLGGGVARTSAHRDVGRGCGHAGPHARRRHADAPGPRPAPLGAGGRRPVRGTPGAHRRPRPTPARRRAERLARLLPAWQPIRPGWRPTAPTSKPAWQPAERPRLPSWSAA